MSENEGVGKVEYDARWFWVEMAEADYDTPPSFSAVPEDRRARVESAWWDRQLAKVPARLWKLWGPQIPMYGRPPYRARTVVLRAVEGSTVRVEDWL